MRISFCLHNHQPVGNFGYVIESAYMDCYLPLLEALERHPGIACGVHISGSLLEWIHRSHPQYIERTGALCRSGRMELLTSGRYEPVLTVFREADIVQQIMDYSARLAQLSGTAPEGLWLTERVWEPKLPSILHEAGVSWAVVDDIHLRRAGVSGLDLFRPCITEDSGKVLRLLGSSRDLRYCIPFSPVEEVLRKLKEMHDEGADLVFYGDDGEKFGVWPGTHKLCFEEGWLDDFFGTVESAEWLESVLPSVASSGVPSGPFYIPASSYAEMGEWTLRGKQRCEYDELLKQLHSSGKKDAAETFVTGGFWRNFLTAYPESKELHGRILSAESVVKRSGNIEALHHFWRSQCNCAFWHGVFGGIYLPHLREALWKELSCAEWIALNDLDCYPHVLNEDINADGFDETSVITPAQSLLVHPDFGLTVSELTFIHSDGTPVPFGHVLTRQPEEYHKSIPGVESSGTVRTIHDGMASKEEGLAGKVLIDRWRRMCFTDLCLPPPSSSLEAVFSDWKLGHPGIVHFQKPRSSGGSGMDETSISMSGEFVEGDFRVSKSVIADLKKSTLTAVSEYTAEPGTRVGMEICINLMTGESPERYFTIDSGDRYLMSHTGEFHGERIHVSDSWRKAGLVIEFSGGSTVWVAPLDSVNRSESGYESVHQGTAFYISSIVSETGRLNMKVFVRMEAINGS
jgi:4-alpha-glucanotransferase